MHLVGGGWTPVGDPAITATFLAEASVRAAGSGRMVPRIGVLIAVTGDTPSPESRDGYPASLRAVAACEPIVTIVEAGDTFAPRVLTDIAPEEEQTMIALLERMARNLGWEG